MADLPVYLPKTCGRCANFLRDVLDRPLQGFCTWPDQGLHAAVPPGLPEGKFRLSGHDEVLVVKANATCDCWEPVPRKT